MISCEFFKCCFFNMGPNRPSTLSQEINAKFTAGIAEIQAYQQGQFPPIMLESQVLIFWTKTDTRKILAESQDNRHGVATIWS